MKRLAEIQRRPVPSGANGGNTMLLPPGMELLKIGEDGTLYLGRYEGAENDQEPDWRYEAAEFLAGLDPKEVDRMALQGLSMDDEGGAAAILRVVREMLGVQDGLS